jgi:hypothetical protein
MRSPLLVALLTLTSSACLVPPSLYERASWGPPTDHWQQAGRFRQADRVGVPADEEVDPAMDGSVPTSTDPHASEAEPAPKDTPPLYAWDGGIVDGPPQGRVEEEQRSPRGIETPPAGRMHIIELYQQVLDERDALSEEVELLRKNLDATAQALEAKTREAGDLAVQVESLQTAHQGLMADNQGIAARLVQAQIRRLEAEKLLLETRIELERSKAEEAARAAAAQTRAGAARPKPPATSGTEGKEHE